MRSAARALVLILSGSAVVAVAALAACVGDDPDTAPAPAADAAPGDAPPGTDASDGATPSADAANPGTIEQLAAGLSFACARTSGGFVYCWGDNSLAQTGQPANGDVLCG